MQRGSSPRVYRNVLVFLAADAKQLDGVRDAVRASLAWQQILRDKDRLDLKQSDEALAEAKVKDAIDTMKARLRETWCYLIYPVQESAQSDVDWVRDRIAAQDGVLSRASKKLVSDEGLLAELGANRLDRDLQRYIWHDKPHLFLKDIWEYLSRYTYLPRIKNQSVLVKAVQSAVSNILPGPFAYAESWDDVGQAYRGLVVEKAARTPVVVDRDSVIIRSEIALEYLKRHSAAPADPAVPGAHAKMLDPGPGALPLSAGPGEAVTTPVVETVPTRFEGTVMISPERPAREIHQIVEGIVEQLTTIPGSDVTLKLEIVAEVPVGLDRAKVRTLLENAATLGFLDKKIN